MKPELPVDPHRRFPDDFVWGVATSCVPDRRRGRCRRQGRRRSGTASAASPAPSPTAATATSPATTTTACDDDLDLIASLGVDAYRFSVSWPRVQPAGHGAWNAARPGLLRAPGRWPAGARHQALPDAQPLGPARRPCRQRGGWAAARHRAPLRRLRARHARAAGRPRSPPSPPTTNPGSSSTWATRSGVFAPGQQAAAPSRRRCRTTCCSVTAWRCRRCAPTGCRSAAGHRAQPGADPRRPPHSEPTSRTRRLEDGRLVRWYMDPLFHGALPGRRARVPRRRRAARRSRRHGGHRHADGLPRHQLLLAHRGQRRRLLDAPAAAAWRSPTWAGRSTPRA